MRNTLLAISALTLPACGPSLGEYEVVDLSVVGDLPDAIRSSREAEPYLRIELRSQFDLVADTNGNIYPFKVSCSTPGDDRRMVFGPLTGGEPSLDLLDAEPAMDRDANGMAHYVIFVRVTAPAELPYANSDVFEPAHDLANMTEDLCLEISQAGYFLTPSRSRMIRISPEEIAAALEQAGDAQITTAG